MNVELIGNENRAHHGVSEGEVGIGAGQIRKDPPPLGRELLAQGHLAVVREKDHLLRHLGVGDLAVAGVGAVDGRRRPQIARRDGVDLAAPLLVELVERSASCDLYALLKRPDEKYVSERAYENPRFVEDIVRDIAAHLKQDGNITWFAVSAENFERIRARYGPEALALFPDVPPPRNER